MRLVSTCWCSATTLAYFQPPCRAVLGVNSLLTGLHLLLTCLRVTSWWEHVDTHANPADGGSRQGTSCKLAKRLGIPLEWVKFPFVPACMAAAGPTEWLKFFKSSTQPRDGFQAVSNLWRPMGITWLWTMTERHSRSRKTRHDPWTRQGKIDSDISSLCVCILRQACEGLNSSSHNLQENDSLCHSWEVLTI